MQPHVRTVDFGYVPLFSFDFLTKKEKLYYQFFTVMVSGMFIQFSCCLKVAAAPRAF